MKKIIFTTLIFATLLVACGDKATTTETEKTTTTESTTVAVKIETPTVVEASCGQCKFGLTGQGCDLAVKIDGQAYYVDGSSMADHGDAHGAEGMCNVVRKAEVVGEVVDGKFKATQFSLLSE